MEIPQVGLTVEEVFQRLARFKQGDAPWQQGRVLTGVYDPGPNVHSVVQRAYASFLSENALYPNLFPSLLQLENDIVRMLANLLNGGGQASGNCTTGGTESILVAVKAARDWAMKAHPEITQPEMVLPRTAHPAFHKAAHYLGIRPVVAGFDAHTFRADPAAMRQAVTPNTILLAASAPCYSHGVVDPISEIAQIALERGLLFHVDACVGGLFLSMMRKAGYSVPEFDFNIPGVTSISVDLHKFGYAAKNVSVILFHSRDLRRFALFSCSETTGYAVINTTMLSSKSGGPMAGAWAALNVLGEAGYIQIVRETMEASSAMIAGIQTIPGLRVLGQPDMCIFALASDELNIFELDDEMSARGWWLQPQFSAPGSPPNLHISVNRSNVAHVDQFLADLRSSVSALKAGGGVGDTAALQAEVIRLMSSPSPNTFAQIAALAGMLPGVMPSSFARINTVLDAMPRSIVDSLLVEYLNSLYA